MPPRFVELDPAEVTKALEGQQDVLSDLRKQQDEFYASRSCPSCGSTEHTREFHSVTHAYGQGAVLPRWVLRCRKCTCLFDPHSNILLTRGT